MIILTDEDKSAKALEALETKEDQEHSDLPPTYASISEYFTSSSPTVSSPMVNYITISKIHDEIKEILAINPSLYVNHTLRPPLLKGETEWTRKNITLDTVHGCIESEVTFIDPNQEKKRATMRVSSIHGNINLKIHDHPSRPAISLYAKAQSRDMKLLLPPSFHGPISISYMHGKVKRSSDMNRNFVTFSDVDGVMKSFLGDGSMYMGKGWKGDELEIAVLHGNVILEYVQ